MFGFPGYLLPGETILPVQVVGAALPHARTIGRYLPGMAPQLPWGPGFEYEAPPFGYDGYGYSDGYGYRGFDWASRFGFAPFATPFSSIPGQGRTQQANLGGGVGAGSGNPQGGSHPAGQAVAPQGQVTQNQQGQLVDQSGNVMVDQNGNPVQMAPNRTRISGFLAIAAAVAIPTFVAAYFGSRKATR